MILIIDSNLKLEKHDVDEGDYLYEFIIIDWKQNIHVTDYMVVEIRG